MGTVTHLETGRVPADTLASRLMLLRFELGVSQREAAARTGVPFGTWQGMEAGRSTRNRDEHVAKISAATGYDLGWLMWGKRPEAISPDDGGGVTVSYPQLAEVVPLRPALAQAS